MEIILRGRVAEVSPMQANMTHEEREKLWKGKDRVQIWSSIIACISALGATFAGTWFVLTQLVMIPHDVVNLKLQVATITTTQNQMHDEQTQMHEEQAVMKTDLKNVDGKVDHAVRILDRIDSKV